MEWEIIKTEYVYGFCSEAVAPIIWGVTIVFTLKIVIQFLLVFKKKGHEKNKNNI